MGILDKFVHKTYEESSQERMSTSEMFLGSPEAESEANSTPIKLNEFFQDYLNVLSQLNEEKFIVLGRKGSGKTAIGETIYDLAVSDPNLFCKFIKKTDIDVEKIVQIGRNSGFTTEASLFYKWVILTQLLALLTQNRAIESHPAMKHLTKFVQRNRGFIDIRKEEISETIRKEGFSVGAESLNRALSLMGAKEASIKCGKADYTKLLPGLEHVVIQLLKYDADNRYILIFDDLDVGYSTNIADNVEAIADLLRMVRYFNIDCLGRNQIDSKIIVLLRSDISKSLIYSADMGKIINSYAIELNWYEDIHRNNEIKLRLRQFINKRISLNFIKKRYQINDKRDPWTSFVDETTFYGEKTGFKYIIDHTFFRPRDLVLFFKDIDTLDLEVPISSTQIKNQLMRRYTVAMVRDLKGELSLTYDKNTIDRAFDTLRDFSNRDPFAYNDLCAQLLSRGIAQELVHKLSEDLFEYSLIGLFDNGNVSFKFREGSLDEVQINKQGKYILHYLLQAFYRYN